MTSRVRSSAAVAAARRSDESPRRSRRGRSGGSRPRSREREHRRGDVLVKQAGVVRRSPRSQSASPSAIVSMAVPTRLSSAGIATIARDSSSSPLTNNCLWAAAGHGQNARQNRRTPSRRDA